MLNINLTDKKNLINKSITNNKKNIIKENEKLITNTKKENIKISLTKVIVDVAKNDTFVLILKKFNFTDKIIFEIISEVEKFYDLRRL